MDTENNGNLLDLMTGGKPVTVQHELIMTAKTAIIIFIVIVGSAILKKTVL